MVIILGAGHGPRPPPGLLAGSDHPGPQHLGLGGQPVLHPGRGRQDHQTPHSGEISPPLHSEFLLSVDLDHPKLHREQIQPSSSSESCWQVRFLLIAELRNLVYSYSVSVHRIRTLEIVTTVVYFVVSSCSSLHFILTTLRFQAYKDAQDENKVVPGTNTPTRSNGIVSRAMEYMFGW